MKLLRNINFKLKRKMNYPMLVLALSCIFGGTSIIYRGALRTIPLGDEKYFVGGAAIVCGLYFLFIVIQDARKNKIS